MASSKQVEAEKKRGERNKLQRTGAKTSGNADFHLFSLTNPFPLPIRYPPLIKVSAIFERRRSQQVFLESNLSFFMQPSQHLAETLLIPVAKSRMMFVLNSNSLFLSLRSDFATDNKYV
jgi:hypothetical protein